MGPALRPAAGLRRRSRVAIVVMVFAVGLGGCGDDEGDIERDPIPETTDADTDADNG